MVGAATPGALPGSRGLASPPWSAASLARPKGSPPLECCLAFVCREGSRGHRAQPEIGYAIPYPLLTTASQARQRSTSGGPSLFSGLSRALLQCPDLAVSHSLNDHLGRT